MVRHATAFGFSLVVLLCLCLWTGTFGGWNAASVPTHETVEPAQAGSASTSYLVNPGCGGLDDKVSAPNQRIYVNQSECQFKTIIAYTQYGSGSTQANGSESTGNEVLSYNLTVSVDEISEFNPAGQIVRVANLSGGPAIANSSINSSGTTILENVTEGVSNVIDGSPQVAGAWTRVAFILQFPPPNSEITGIKFSIDIGSWPWASQDDHLGLEVGSVAEPGTSFSWNNTTSELSESFDGHPSLAAIQMGASAKASNATNLGVSTTSQVNNHVGSPSNAHLFLNFTGPGGSSYINYDPWILLSTAPFPATTTVILEWVIVAAVAGIGVTSLFAVVAFKVRRGDSDGPSLGLGTSQPHTPQPG